MEPSQQVDLLHEIGVLYVEGVVRQRALSQLAEELRGLREEVEKLQKEPPKEEPTIGS